MTREKFPEKIPFRLTRMLTNAMEVRFLSTGLATIIILSMMSTFHRPLIWAGVIGFIRFLLFVVPTFLFSRLICFCAQVTGLDGNYRITCHTVMEVLREHRDSVMAVLEAFVYDPLLNWRLMDSE